MTTDPARPGRIAGLALLGVAAVATVIGVVTLVSGEGDEGNAQEPPPSVTNQPNPGASSTAPQETTGPPPTTVPTTAAPTTTQPTQPPQPPPGQPTTGQDPGQQGPGQQNPPNPVTAQPVRVYNNSFIKGLGDRAAADLSNGGWNVVETGNYNGKVPVTTVYYRPGTEEEATAKAIATQFGIRAEPRFEGIQDSSPGVIFIVTKEYAGPKGKQ